MNNDVLVIGLTGPSGAGKTQVVDLLTADKHIVSIDMDKLAREVTAVGSDCLKKLAKTFSDTILNDDGSLNRKKLAEIAFASPQKTQMLNDITHPAIIAKTDRLLTQYREDPFVDAVILDAPLLLESGMDSICDKVIAVLADFETRVSRICARDGISEEAAKLRLARQHTDTFYADKADAVVYNNGDKDMLAVNTAPIIENIKEWLQIAFEKTNH
ncbi:MAG: dephospho-CoA kinase [Clostridia bacterium]|nr:dephospho-CoA kinase [Clostridia bacterium]